MATFEAAYSGTYGGSYRFRLDLNEIAVDTANNTSTIQITLYMIRVSSNGGDIFNNFATGWSANIDGQGYSGSIVYGHLGTGSTVTMLNTTKVIAHNADGTRSFGFSASHNADDLPYLGSASLSGSMNLTTINRFATITQFFLDSITDEQIRINWAADVTCNAVSWWSNAYDGGTHHDIAVNGAGVFQITLNKLLSDKLYDFTVAVRRADSNLWTNSGTLTTTTLAQNKFFDMPEI